jgi:ribosomal protein L44E
MVVTDRVNTFCEACQKETEQEIRQAEGQDALVCLACEETAIKKEIVRLDYLNQTDSQG